MTDVVSGLVGHLAHRYLNVDPTTGRIIGAIAGNLIFNLGKLARIYFNNYGFKFF